MLEFMTQSAWAERIGWVLVHSLWQFVLVALLVVVLKWTLARRSAAIRYWALLAVMFVMVAAPVATWLSPWSADAPVPAVEMPDNILTTQHVSPFEVREDATAARVARPERSDGRGESPGGAATPFAEPQGRATQGAASGLAWSLSLVETHIRPWLPQIVLIWFAGVLLAAFRPLLSWYTVRRLKTVGVSPVAGAVRCVLDRTAKTLRVARAVGLLQSALVKTPVVVGYFRPAILLPLCVVTGLPESQLELILAHELAHIRRHDYLINLLQTLIETLFFYHPAVWWLSRQIRNERENCCDDVAMATTGSRADYGRALLAIEELRAKSTALSLAARGGSLLARIRRIAGCEPAPRVAGGASILCVILASIVIFAAVAWAAAPKEEKPGGVAHREESDGHIEPRAIPAMPRTDPQGVPMRPFEARLPDGVTLQLLGVSENPSKDPTWWRPDGSPLAERPYEWPGASVAVGKDEMTRDFAVRLSNTPSEPVAIRWRIEPSLALCLRDPPGHGGNAPEVRGVAVRMPAAQQTANVYVGVAAGTWQTIAESQGREAIGGTWNVVFSPVEASDGGITVTVAHDLIDAQGDGPQTRLIAIARDGREHHAESSENSRAGRLSQLTLKFPKLPRKDLKALRFQSRPYTWAEFRSVSLQSGKKTDVQVVLPGTDQPGAPLSGKAEYHEAGGFHLVRGNTTWIGTEGPPLVYDDYDKHFYLSRGAHTVVLPKHTEGFWDFYGQRTLEPGIGRMDVHRVQWRSGQPANIVMPGLIDLPAYQLLLQPSAQRALNLSDEQRTRLRDISAKYWPERRKIAGKELDDMEAAAQRELAVEDAKAGREGCVRSGTGPIGGKNSPFSKDVVEKLERQWTSARKQIEDVLTPEQLRTLKDLTFRTFAFGSGVMFEPEVLAKLGVPKQQQDKLHVLELELQKEKDRRLRKVPREKITKMFAVLTPQQLAQLREQHSPDKNPDTDCAMYPYPMLPSHMPDTGVAEELGFSAEQRQRVRKIVTAHWNTLIALDQEKKKLAIGDEKGRKAIDEKRRQEMADLRKKIEAALTPEQWASCKEMAFENQAIPNLRMIAGIAQVPGGMGLTDRLRMGVGMAPVSGGMGLTGEQIAALREIDAEYSDKAEQVYRELTDKALAAFTPAQREKLRADVDRRGW